MVQENNYFVMQDTVNSSSSFDNLIDQLKQAIVACREMYSDVYSVPYSESCKICKLHRAVCLQKFNQFKTSSATSLALPSAFFWTDGMREKIFDSEEEAQEYSEEMQMKNCQGFSDCNRLNPFMGGQFYRIQDEGEKKSDLSILCLDKVEDLNCPWNQQKNRGAALPPVAIKFAFRNDEIIRVQYLGPLMVRNDGAVRLQQ